MADLTIDFQMPGNAAQLYERLKLAIADNKGTLSGDINAGSFQVPSPFGEIKGRYEVAGEHGKVTVTEKPFFLADSLVEDKLREALEKYGTQA
ncbi:MAG: hypothetical protein AAGK14_11265 [Verrucomicrobiota bacterium]